ncbi:hypothetical protein T440DRAFT_142303 [Plenodomus tracheiphilus IPT5]|uniref:Uncharacterized protein n=1 Tax=Plenodomus tracheiphilus IPT5 TaxID=1408161 RepID=A0A6A7B3M2_9PLEO|nr:hypothetical protein T440DRAFT_142303 [Plenodomus tracheiphilus IPT5]
MAAKARTAFAILATPAHAHRPCRAERAAGIRGMDWEGTLPVAARAGIGCTCGSAASGAAPPPTQADMARRQPWCCAAIYVYTVLCFRLERTSTTGIRSC